MTTKDSPLHLLKKQADEMAAKLKAFERGEMVAVQFADKLRDARRDDGITVGIAMDDKVLKMRLLWDVIRETSEAALSEYIVKQMRERGDTLQ